MTLREKLESIAETTSERQLIERLLNGESRRSVLPTVQPCLLRNRYG